MKRVAMAAGLVVIAGVVAGCGSGGAPTAASVDDFCRAVLDQGGVTGGAGIKDYAQHLEDVGTPADMPDDARQGFEIFLREAKKVDDSASEGDLTTLGQNLSASDQVKVGAYATYVTDTCLKANLPSNLPTNLPTNLPSDLASDLPSDFPTDLPSDVPSNLDSMMSDLDSTMSELSPSP